MSVDTLIQVRPLLIERLVYWTLYYWAVGLAGGVFLVPESLVVFAINGEFDGRIGPVGMVLVALGWAIVAIPFVRWAHRINRSFVDRSTLRLTATALSLGRNGQTEVELGDVCEAYYVARCGWVRRRYEVVTRRRFDVLLLVLANGAFVPLAPELRQFGDGPPLILGPFVERLLALLGSKVRDGGPLPPEAMPFLRQAGVNRLHFPADPLPPLPRRIWATVARRVRATT